MFLLMLNLQNQGQLCSTCLFYTQLSFLKCFVFQFLSCSMLIHIPILTRDSRWTHQLLNKRPGKGENNNFRCLIDRWRLNIYQWLCWHFDILRKRSDFSVCNNLFGNKSNNACSSIAWFENLVFPQMLYLKLQFSGHFNIKALVNYVWKF